MKFDWVKELNLKWYLLTFLVTIVGGIVALMIVSQWLRPMIAAMVVTPFVQAGSSFMLLWPRIRRRTALWSIRMAMHRFAEQPEGKWWKRQVRFAQKARLDEVVTRAELIAGAVQELMNWDVGLRTRFLNTIEREQLLDLATVEQIRFQCQAFSFVSGLRPP